MLSIEQFPSGQRAILFKREIFQKTSVRTEWCLQIASSPEKILTQLAQQGSKIEIFAPSMTRLLFVVTLGKSRNHIRNPTQWSPSFEN